MKLRHTLNVLRVRYGRLLAHATLVLAGASLLIVIGMGVWYSFVEYNAATARSRQAEKATKDMEALLSGDLVMIEPVSERYQKMGRVSVRWELIALDKSQ